jgi:hypothetical protein
MVLILFIFSFQTEVFAMVTDPRSEDLIESSKPLSNYGRTDHIESDWYGEDRRDIGVKQSDSDSEKLATNYKRNHKFSDYYIEIKNKTSWILWKRQSKNYDSYIDFKRRGGFNRSISADFKNLFGISKK